MRRSLVSIVAVVVLMACAMGPIAAQQFQDIAPMLGLPGTNGAAWGDYDGDGYPDLFLAGRATPDGHGPMLLRNSHILGFTDVSAAMGFPAEKEEQDGSAWADYDNDGDLDLLVGSGAGYPRLYRRDETQFLEVGQEAGFHVSFSAGRGVAWCDYDGDNLLEAFCANIFGPGYLMENNGDGTFTEVSVASGMDPSNNGQSAAWGDYDRDGWADLMLSRRAARPMLYHNDGDGTFTEVGVAAGLGVASDTFGVAWGDYDNDGWLDCYLSAATLARDWLFHNNGDGTFTDVAATAGMAGDDHTGLGVAWADYDNDGWLDLYVGNLNTDNQPFLYHNNGDGTFTDVAATAGVGGSRPNQTAIWGDMDLDGRMDLFSGVGGPLSALFHNVGPVGHWLRVRVLTSGTGDAVEPGIPVRDAVGARVELNLDNDDSFPSGRTLTRTIDGGSSFLGQNEQVAHFGVGWSGVVAARVRFPDGSVVTHRSVPVNQQITIRDVPADRTEEIFDDVPLDFWAYEAIKACVEAGIVTGFPEGDYKPDQPVNRAQMAVYASRGVAGGEENVPEPTADPGFTDVGDTHWAYKYICYAVDQNVVSGYPEGDYRPDQEVTRGQMAVYMARAMVAPTTSVLDDYVPADPRDFPDVPSSYWAYTYVEYCVEQGVVGGFPEGDYRPDMVVTRDQMAVYVARAFGLVS